MKQAIMDRLAKLEKRPLPEATRKTVIVDCLDVDNSTPEGRAEIERRAAAAEGPNTFLMVIERYCDLDDSRPTLWQDESGERVRLEWPEDEAGAASLFDDQGRPIRD